MQKIRSTKKIRRHRTSFSPSFTTTPARSTHSTPSKDAARAYTTIEPRSRNGNRVLSMAMPMDAVNQAHPNALKCIVYSIHARENMSRQGAFCTGSLTYRSGHQGNPRQDPS